MAILYVMYLFTIYFGVSFPRAAEGEQIATNTFTYMYDTPIGDGIWRAVATCDTEFPGKSYDANSAWMFSRFGVPMTNYQDWLAGAVEETDDGGKWVISRIGYASGAYSLTYSLQFEYNAWLGSDSPTGDCVQFTNLTEAKIYAGSAATLLDTPASTLLDTASLDLVSTNPTSTQGLCQFSFSGLQFGARESMILVSFTVPVKYQSDYSGNQVLHSSVDSTWYIVLNPFAFLDICDYHVNYIFTTADHDTSSAYCSLYVSESDALAAANQIDVTSTTVDPISVMYVATSETPPTTSTVPGTVVPVTVAHTPVSNRITGFLFESDEMRDMYVAENNLWDKDSVNELHCGRLCLADDNCVSVFYSDSRSKCTGHSVVYESGGTVAAGVIYYVLQ